MKKEPIPTQAEHMYSERTDRAWNRIRETIEGEPMGVPDQKLPFIRQSWRMVAAIVLLAAISAALWLFVKPISHSVKVKTKWNQKQFVLPDGSIVYLNGNSILTYPAKFSASQRRVELKGEAFFKVTKERSRPFIIQTNDATVQVYGTTFNVRSLSNKHRVEVWVNSGLVGLSPNNKKSGAIILHKGEFGLLEGGEAKKLPLDAPNYVSWHTKVFRFESTPLPKVVAVLSRAYAKPVVLADSSLRQLKLTASFDGARLDTVIKSICMTFDLSWEEKKNEITLRISK